MSSLKFSFPLGYSNENLNMRINWSKSFCCGRLHQRVHWPQSSEDTLSAISLSSMKLLCLLELCCIALCSDVVAEFQRDLHIITLSRSVLQWYKTLFDWRNRMRERKLFDRWISPQCAVTKSKRYIKECHVFEFQYHKHFYSG